MKTYYITLTLILAISLQSFSQQRNTGPQSSAFSNNLETFGIQLAEKVFNSNELDDIEGSYYLHKTWNKCKANVQLNKRHLKINFNCNYNLASKELEIKASNDSIYALNNSILKELYINYNKYTFHDIDSSNKFVKIIGSKKDLYYFIEDYNIEIQSVRTTTLGLFKNKIVKKSKQYIVYNNQLYKYNKKNLTLLNKGIALPKSNSVIQNLQILNNNILKL